MSAVRRDRSTFCGLWAQNVEDVAAVRVRSTFCGLRLLPASGERRNPRAVASSCDVLLPIGAERRVHPVPRRPRDVCVGAERSRRRDRARAKPRDVVPQPSRRIARSPPSMPAVHQRPRPTSTSGCAAPRDARPAPVPVSWLASQPTPPPRELPQMQTAMLRLDRFLRRRKRVVLAVRCIAHVSDTSPAEGGGGSLQPLRSITGTQTSTAASNDRPGGTRSRARRRCARRRHAPRPRRGW